MSKMFTEVIQFEPAAQQAKHSEIEKQIRAQQHMERLDADYKDWQNCRDFVLENIHRLKDTKVKVDVYQMTNLPNLNCAILNDHILVPYHEAEEMIRKLDVEHKEFTFEQIEKAVKKATETGCDLRLALGYKEVEKIDE